MIDPKELSNQAIGQMADMFIAYHKRSFRIRAQAFFSDFDLDFPLPVVDELDNARRRLENDYVPEERISWAFGFHEIISKNRYKIKELADEAKEMDDARPAADDIAQLMEEMDAATWLLELLNG
jgi:hypothetical protein